VNNGLGAQ